MESENCVPKKVKVVVKKEIKKIIKKELAKPKKRKVEYIQLSRTACKKNGLSYYRAKENRKKGCYTRCHKTFRRAGKTHYDTVLKSCVKEPKIVKEVEIAIKNAIIEEIVRDTTINRTKQLDASACLTRGRHFDVGSKECTVKCHKQHFTFNVVNQECKGDTKLIVKEIKKEVVQAIIKDVNEPVVVAEL